jgi:hypothetical protein
LALLAFTAKVKRKRNFRNFSVFVGGPFWSGGRPPSGGRPGARAPWTPLNPALPLTHLKIYVIQSQISVIVAVSCMSLIQLQISTIHIKIYLNPAITYISK